MSTQSTATQAPMGIGIVGAGVISDEYLTTLAAAPDVTVRFIADLDVARAEAQATKHGVPAWGTLEELLADPTVELVVNITIPKAHAEVSRAALESGRHVWSEKPLATSLDDAAGLVELADQRGLRLGCAPDTFLGPGPQAALALVKGGSIGSPRTGFAMSQYNGPDFWHPSPEFLFAAGAGPVLDVGPYILTTLVLVFGSLERVTARGLITRPRRTIGAGPKAGTEFDVHVPTHITALYEFAGGALVDVVLSNDSPIARGVFEVAGAEGAVAFGSVGTFDDEATAYAMDATTTSVPAGDSGGLGRGTGAVDMVRSIRGGEHHRADGALALHVLEGLLATEEAMRTCETVAIASQAPSPALLPPGWSLTAG